MVKKLLYLQTVILAGGVLFSWTTLASQFRIFLDLYGTIFRFQDCAIPNPLATACFYGALALLGAFIWSVLLVQKYSAKSQRCLRNFLLFGVFFALSVLSYEFLEFYHVFSFEANVVSCSPGTHPLQTPCFYGMLFFLGAFLTALTITRSPTETQENIHD